MEIGISKPLTSQTHSSRRSKKRSKNKRNAQALRYIYKPLKPATQDDGEFRLLTLLPGQPGSDLVCHIPHDLINSPPPYEALSYTWGDPKSCFNDVPTQCDPTKLYSIHVDGKWAEISYSLHAALQTSEGGRIQSTMGGCALYRPK